MSERKKKSCRKPFTADAQEAETQTEHPARFVAMFPLKLSETIRDWEPHWPELLKEFPANVLFVSDGLRSVLYEQTSMGGATTLSTGNVVGTTVSAPEMGVVYRNAISRVLRYISRVRCPLVSGGRMADSKITPAEKYSIRQSRDIAAEASIEMDPAKLLRLVRELTEALTRESNDKLRTA